MKIDSPIKAYIAHTISFFTDRDLVIWAEKYITDNQPFGDNPDLLELAAINATNVLEITRASTYLSNFVARQWPDFDIAGPEAEQSAKRLFQQRLQQYLADDCRPYDVCKMIVPIELTYDHPGWLGSLYDACDGIEPETTPAECRHLKAEIRKALLNA